MLPRRLLDQAVPYKYVVVKDTESTVYEFIYKQQDKEGKHVNRSLHLRSALLGSGGGSGRPQARRPPRAGAPARRVLAAWRGPTRALQGVQTWGGSQFPSVQPERSPRRGNQGRDLP